MEEERVREEIAVKLVEQGFFQKPDYVAVTHQEMAHYILTSKGIRIEADDQSLPELPLFSGRECPICGGNLKGVPSDWGEGGGLYCEGECHCYVDTDTYREKWVLKAGFVKVLKKE